MFFGLTLLVVAPVYVLVDGVWGGLFAEGVRAEAPLAATLTSLVLDTFIIPALVTALHVVLVQRLARGERPGFVPALRDVRPRLAAALGAVALYALAVAVGLVLLILPGIWISVRWYFAAQSAVVDGAAPRTALDRSAELVEGRWWQTFGLLLLAILITVPFSGVLAVAVAVSDDGVLFVVLSTLVQTIVLSFTALFATLVFFSHQAPGASLAAASERPEPA